MSPWARRASRTIPRTGSPQKTFELNDYSLGMNTYLANDKMPLISGGTNFLRLAQDARIVTAGEYETRRGFDFHSDAAGETLDQSITSTTGAADQSFSTTTWLAQKLTAGANGRTVKLVPRLKNSAAATGTILIEFWTDSGGSPGTLISRTSVAASVLTGSYADAITRLPDAPVQASGTAYWILARIQFSGSGSYKWSSTTIATTAKVSTDSGATWSATSFALNFKQYYATTGGVKGKIRASKSDGTSVTLFAHGTTLYSVNNATGALTAIKTGLNASATHYRFVVVNDIVYYVNGYDGYRKWNFTTESQVNATNYTNILVHKGLMFLNRKDDPNRWDYSNFAAYETFTSTDFIYVPAPKTGDPSAAAISLNGYLLMWTRFNKYILSGDDNATFRLDEAPDQKGTFSQETVSADQNYAYYLSDDGVRRTTGNESQLLSRNNYQDIALLNSKETANLCVNKGRLYLWYTSEGNSANDTCWVWNLNLSAESDTVESIDTEAYVARASTAYNDSDALIVGSSLVGQVYWQELESNDFTNLGGDINYELRTHYMNFNSPAYFHEVRDWVFRVAAQSGAYDINGQYAYDLRENWTTIAPRGVQGSGYTWGDAGTVWGAFTWGSNAEWQFNINVPGEHRRIAFGVKNHATRQPQSFLGNTLVVQTRRLA